ncbi:MAG: DNA mismatch repair endonuclease MutL [Verrucomicrobia bacterium]|nr:DNA mismatch repair endonuclease MutL [Verrucomicrobiota bacterium]
MGAESRIRVLPTHVANKIAAGEVVERPASVVKELMENAIDAGATQVDVAITAGGRKRIAVNDNGGGMNRDDALLAIERQATSKIRDVEDIEHIQTLGFRGEALAAIASASRFRLITCAGEGEPGTEVNVAAGCVQDVREVGRPVGTTIEVRDLFFNIPARRKFLRAHQTEMGHVRHVFLVQALASNRVGMRLNVDGHDVYHLAPAGTLVDRLRDLFGADYLAGLVPVDAGGDGLAVTGYVSRPGRSRADREEQFVFVNGRATSAPAIQYAIREAYRAALQKDRHPAVFLFVSMDPGEVDVNVHPTKREVRFRNGGAVRDAVMAAIGKALATAGASSGDLAASSGEPLTRAAPPWAAEQLGIEGLPSPRAFHYPRAELPPADDTGLAFAGGAAPAKQKPEGDDAAGAPAPAGNSPWAWCSVVGLIGGQYVLLETEDGMVIMDPRAAHERVLYEQFLADVERHRVPGQNLLLPETVAMRPPDAARVRKHLDVMKAMGFGISEFGGDTFVVDALPAYFSETSSQILLGEVAGEIEAAGLRRGSGRWREELVAQAACRAAVRSRARLRLEEVERLVMDLARAEMPYTCPRGRPTLMFTSLKELDRKFGRE